MGGIDAGFCGIHQVPAGECFRMHYPEAHRKSLEDLECMVCGTKITGPDHGKMAVVEWEPIQKGNVVRALLCVNPNCLVIWAREWKYACTKS